MAPGSDGRFVQISKNPGVRYREAVFSSEGDQVIALSDESESRSSGACLLRVPAKDEP